MPQFAYVTRDCRHYNAMARCLQMWYSRNSYFFTCAFVVVTSLLLWSYSHAPKNRNIQTVDVSHQEVYSTDKEQSKERSDPSKKVLIIGYMRGGTTLIDEVLNHDKRAVAWYEPLAPFYGQLYGLDNNRMYNRIVFDGEQDDRELSEWETEMLVAFFKSMYSCDLDSLTTSILGCSFTRNILRFQDYFKKFRYMSKIPLSDTILVESECVAKSNMSTLCGERNQTGHATVITSIAAHCHQFLEVTRSVPASQVSELKAEQVRSMIYARTGYTVSWNLASSLLTHRQCMDTVERNVRTSMKATKLDQVCRQTSIRSSKVLRLRMKYVRNIVQAMPDLHILHYIRNPLAIAQSRVSATSTAQFDNALWIAISKEHCRVILRDKMAADALRNDFPNHIHFLRYEDLVLEPQTTLDKLYSMLGDQAPEYLKSWLYSTMHATGGDDGAFSVRRANGTDSLGKWKSLPDEVKQQVLDSDECKEALSLLGYGH